MTNLGPNVDPKTGKKRRKGDKEGRGKKLAKSLEESGVV